MNNAQEKKTLSSSKASRDKSASSFPRLWVVIVLLVAGLGALGTLWFSVVKGVLDTRGSSSAAGAPVASTSEQVFPVFTTARRSFYSAVKEYFDVQGKPVQPIQFKHSIHIKNGMQCEACHTGVTQGPDAGIPSVTFCMACHQAIATDKPEIKKLAAYAAKGQEPPWQPVYWFYPEVHVKFQHAPHIRNGIACEQCHGDLSVQTVAVRSKDLTMNFCLTCHKAKAASVDCVVCHY